MNLKNYFALSLAAAATMSFAEVATQTTLCRIEVATGATNTIVALPLKTVNSGGTTISVDKLVMTDNLAAGDELMYWDAEGGNGGVWARWLLQSQSSGLKWVPQTTQYTDANKETKDYNNNFESLPCGKALWLNRIGTGSDLTKPFYLYGECITGLVSSDAAAGTADAPVYTLMSYPKAEALSLTAWASKIAEGVMTPGSVLAVNTPDQNYATEYVWKDGGWKKQSLETTTLRGRTVVKKVYTAVTDSDKIPAGQGFWFGNIGGSVRMSW